jgi:subfamily B ATP-binding cassette protein MsbA
VGQATLINRVGHNLVGRMQVELFGRLVRADLARLRSVHSGAVLSAVLYDSTLVREAATSGTINYVQHALTLVAVVAVMATQDPWLTLMVLVAAPLVSVVMRRFAKRTRKAARGAMTETSALSTAVMESMDGVRVVKLENREAFEEARVAAVVDRRQRHVIKGANARATPAPVTGDAIRGGDRGGDRLRRLAGGPGGDQRRGVRRLLGLTDAGVAVASPAGQPAGGVRRRADRCSPPFHRHGRGP